METSTLSERAREIPEWYLDQKTSQNSWDEINKLPSEITYPDSTLVFECFKMLKPGEVKGVIIGQDPYYTPGDATGLAFHCKKKKRSQTILKKAIGDEQGLDTYAREKQILLLNMALTVKRNSPGSHLKYWEDFTKKVICSIIDMDITRPVVFLLMGNHIHKMMEQIVHGRGYNIREVNNGPSQIKYDEIANDKRKVYLIYTAHPSASNGKTEKLKAEHFLLMDKLLKR